MTDINIHSIVFGHNGIVKGKWVNENWYLEESKCKFYYVSQKEH